MPGREGMGGKQGDRGMWDECALGDGPYRRQKIKNGLNKQILLLFVSVLLLELSAEGRTFALSYHCSISHLCMQGTEAPTEQGV